MRILEFALADEFGRYSANNSKWSDIFSDNCSGGDYRPVTDRDSWHDDGARTDKDVIADGDWLATRDKIGGRDVVFLAVNHDF